MRKFCLFAVLFLSLIAEGRFVASKPNMHRQVVAEQTGYTKLKTLGSRFDGVLEELKDWPKELLQKLEQRQDLLDDFINRAKTRPDKLKEEVARLRERVTNGGSLVTELTETAKNHLKYGEIKITIKNSSTGDIISTSVRKPIDPPISVPSSGVNVSVDVSGIHFENALQTGLIEEVANTRALVKTLPSGEQVFKSKIKVFVQEMNNGQGGWKTVANEKTWWPSPWNEQKVWEKISEAFNNKVIDKSSRWHGTTIDGVKIEMYIDGSGNISTAYIIP